MKKIISFSSLFILLMLSGGCTLSSSVEVTNNSGGPVWVTASKASPSSQQELADGGTLIYTASGIDSLDIEVSGMYKLSETKSVPLTVGSTASYTIDADAGILIVSNESVFYLTGVYITSSTSDSWGDNLFTSADYISPDEAYYWTVAPGYWDIYVTNGTYYWDDYYNYIDAGTKATFNVGTLSNWWSGSESFDKSNTPEKPVEYIAPERG